MKLYISESVGGHEINIATYLDPLNDHLLDSWTAGDIRTAEIEGEHRTEDAVLHVEELEGWAILIQHEDEQPLVYGPFESKGHASRNLDRARIDYIERVSDADTSDDDAVAEVLIGVRICTVRMDSLPIVTRLSDDPTTTTKPGIKPARLDTSDGYITTLRVHGENVGIGSIYAVTFASAETVALVGFVGQCTRIKCFDELTGMQVEPLLWFDDHRTNHEIGPITRDDIRSIDVVDGPWMTPTEVKVALGE